MIRRYGERVDPDQIYQHRPGAYVILPRDGTILLTHQAKPTPEFQLPGGGIDPGEHPIAAVHREVFEETGWRIGPPQKLGAFRRFVYMPEYEKWAEKLCHIYVARPIYRLGPPTEPNHTAIFVDQMVALDFLGNEGDAAFLRLFLG